MRRCCISFHERLKIFKKKVRNVCGWGEILVISAAVWYCMKKNKNRERKESGEKRENSAADCWRWKKVGLCLIALGFRSTRPHNPRCFPPCHPIFFFFTVFLWPRVFSIWLAVELVATGSLFPHAPFYQQLHRARPACVSVCLCVVEAEKRHASWPFRIVTQHRSPVVHIEE